MKKQNWPSRPGEAGDPECGPVLADAVGAELAAGSLARAGVLEVMAQLAILAGAPVLRALEQGPAARYKADLSPVTDADEAAEKIILGGLADRFPDVPAVAEEASAGGFTPTCGALFFLVDPLDGTREFLNRSQEFTVNIALVREGEPVAGVVYAPVLGDLWVGCSIPGSHIAARGHAEAGGAPPPFAQMRQIGARRRPATGLTALVSRSHPDSNVEPFLSGLPVVARRAMGSSLKFCVLAEGEADVYPRFGRTMEWDTAAGDAVLRAAGGVTLGPSGAPLRYGKAEAGFANPSFVAWGQAPGDDA